MSEAFICDAVRTPIGRVVGALSHTRADDLAALPLKALVERNRAVDWDAVDDPGPTMCRSLPNKHRQLQGNKAIERVCCRSRHANPLHRSAAASARAPHFTRRRLAPYRR